MPFPKVSTPTYELELPSTGQTIEYRPFLVREEKLLVLSLESENMKEITKAIKTVIKSCIKTKNIKVESLPTFDIEYLFLNIRGKSVGEQVEVKITAPDDGETPIDVTINIDDIKVKKNDKHTNKIKIDDNLIMEMKYPSLDQFIKSNFDFSEGNNIDQSFDMIADCVDKIYNQEEVWSTADVTKKEVVEFLEQLNTMQFKEIEHFFDTMPRLSHEVKVKNPKTKVESTVVLEGLASFFG